MTVMISGGTSTPFFAQYGVILVVNFRCDVCSPGPEPKKATVAWVTLSNQIREKT